jgi:hypothetical protein
MFAFSSLSAHQHQPRSSEEIAMDKRDGEEVVAIKKLAPRFHAGTPSMVFPFIAAALPTSTHLRYLDDKYVFVVTLMPIRMDGPSLALI